jgi:hypothetical protein
LLFLFGPWECIQCSPGGVLGGGGGAGLIKVKDTKRSVAEVGNVELVQGGELVAQFKATVLLMPNGSDRITNVPLQKLEVEKSVQDEDLKKLLQASLKSKKKNKKKGKTAEKENQEAVAVEN